MVDFKTVVAVGWLVMYTSGAALLGVLSLSYGHVKVGRLEFHLGMRTFEGLAYLIMGPAVAVAVAGSYITRANTGEWGPDDFRTSVVFIDFCWFLVLAMAPISALWGAGILVRTAWHRRDRRKDLADPDRIHAEDSKTVEWLSPGAASKKHKKTKRGN